MENEKQIEVINGKIKELQAEVDLLSKPVDTFTRWDLVPIDTPVIVGFNFDPKARRHFHSEGGVQDDGRTSRTNKRGGIGNPKNMKLDTEAENIYAYKPWFGGECPVDSSQIVKLIFGNGTIKVCRAGEWSWRPQTRMQVILYSVIK